MQLRLLCVSESVLRNLRANAPCLRNDCQNSLQRRSMRSCRINRTVIRQRCRRHAPHVICVRTDRHLLRIHHVIAINRSRTFQVNNHTKNVNSNNMVVITRQLPSHRRLLCQVGARVSLPRPTCLKRQRLAILMFHLLVRCSSLPCNKRLVLSHPSFLRLLTQCRSVFRINISRARRRIIHLLRLSQ